MFEKRLAAVPPQLFTSNGTADGRITVADASLFKVKQAVNLSGTALPNLNLEIKSIPNGTTIFVGPIGPGIVDRTDISLYTTAATSFIFANEQLRPKIPEQEIERHTYEEEPTVARRVVMVDPMGNKYGEGNPLPIAFDGTVSVGNVTIQDDDGDELEINTDGSINVNVVSSPSSVPGLDVTYQETSAVASGSETTLISIVSPPSGMKIYKVDFGGENIALFRLKINGVTKSSKRTFFGGNLNDSFQFEPYTNGLELAPADILTITVVHNRPMTANFEVAVMGLNL